MSKCIVFVNQKGGVGKTTSAINIGAYIALAGKKVLLVDFDSQGNMSSGVGVTKDKPTVYELLAGMVKPEDAVKHTPVQNLDAISASIDLSGAAIELVDQENREYFLKNALEPLKSQYDYILIDCPPALGFLTLNSLCASDSVMIPLQCEFFALEGVSHLMNTIQLVQQNFNKELEIEGVLLTMYDRRNKLSELVEKDVRSCFGELVFKTIIPRNVRISEAPSHGKPVILYDLDCMGSQAYINLAAEFLTKNEEKKLKKVA